MGYLNGDPDQSDWPGSSRPGHYHSETFGLIGSPFTWHKWIANLLDRCAVTCESVDDEGWLVGTYPSEADYWNGADPLDMQSFPTPDEAAAFVASLMGATEP